MGRKRTQEEFVLKSQLIHNNKYSYENVKYINGITKVNIFCNDCSVYFDQCPDLHLSGRGHGNCAYKAIATKLSKTTNQFIIEANAIHQNNYDYSLVNYINILTEVNIKCLKCDLVFLQKPKRHLKGGGKCPACCPIEHTASSFIQCSIKIHGDIFDYSQIKFVNTATPVVIKCKICSSSFNRRPTNHLRGDKCLKCFHCQLAKDRSRSLEKFIDEAKLVHKNNFDYSNVIYVNERTLIKLKCNRCDLIFNQFPANHLNGSECKKCKINQKQKISRQETKWLDLINIPIEYRNIRLFINNKRYNVDAINKETNTIYEFYGDYWHGNPKTHQSNKINKHMNKTFGELYKRTIDRENALKKAGYNIVSIWENDFKQQLIQQNKAI